MIRQPWYTVPVFIALKLQNTSVSKMVESKLRCACACVHFNQSCDWLMEAAVVAAAPPWTGINGCNTSTHLLQTEEGICIHFLTSVVNIRSVLNPCFALTALPIFTFISAWLISAGCCSVCHSSVAAGMPHKSERQQSTIVLCFQGYSSTFTLTSIKSTAKWICRQLCKEAFWYVFRYLKGHFKCFSDSIG